MYRFTLIGTWKGQFWRSVLARFQSSTQSPLAFRPASDPHAECIFAPKAFCPLSNKCPLYVVLRPHSPTNMFIVFVLCLVFFKYFFHSLSLLAIHILLDFPAYFPFFLGHLCNILFLFRVISLSGSKNYYLSFSLSHLPCLSV